MPHTNPRSGDDLASTDEVKVYKDEGEEEKKSSENLTEDKLGLVIESEEGKHETRRFVREVKREHKESKSTDYLDLQNRFSFGYPFLPPSVYPYHVGSSFSGLNSLPHPAGLGLYMYNNDLFGPSPLPPTAHLNSLHFAANSGLTSSSSYHLSSSFNRFHYPFLSSEFSQIPWGGSSSYPVPFGSQHPLSRFSPTGVLSPHPNLPYPGISHPTLVSQNIDKLREQPLVGEMSSETRSISASGSSSMPSPPNHHHHHHHHHHRSHIKKPLNAFMIFMKEMRQKVIDECTLKESAAINQILGRKWHSLSRSDQAKYYDMAKREKELHQQLYPGWSARDNYACHTKKRRKHPTREDGGRSTLFEEQRDCPNAKKCRARFGLDKQNQWCKSCRRKKRCIRFLQNGDSNDDESRLPTADSTTGSDLCFSPPMSSSSSSSSSNCDEKRHDVPAADENCSVEEQYM